MVHGAWAAGMRAAGRLRYSGIDMFEIAVNAGRLKGRTRESSAFAAKDEISIAIDRAEVLVFAAPGA